MQGGHSLVVCCVFATKLAKSEASKFCNCPFLVQNSWKREEAPAAHKQVPEISSLRQKPEITEWVTLGFVRLLLEGAWRSEDGKWWRSHNCVLPCCTCQWCSNCCPLSSAPNLLA